MKLWQIAWKYDLYYYLEQTKHNILINSNVYFVKYSNMYRYIDISSSWSIFLYTLKLQTE